LDKNPVVTITMENGGTIKIELLPELARNTVRNFVSLVSSGFYNGLIFHRVIPNFMVQAGCPQGSGVGGPGYSIKGEFSQNGYPNSLHHERGVISMARAANPNSAGSQFFIMVDSAKHLDGQYAGFGRVLEGMEVVDDIVAAKRNREDRPLEDQKIKEMTVDTFGVEWEEPVKV